MLLVREFLAMGLALALLLLWREISSLHCASLILPVLVIMMIMFNRRDYALRRRRCVVGCLLKQDTSLYRIFSGHWLISIVSLLLSIISGSILMLQMILWRSDILLMLALDLLMILALYHGVAYWLQSMARPDMNEVVTKQLVTIINTLFLFAGFVMLQLYATFPEYLIPYSFSQTLAAASESVSSSCDVTQLLLKLLREQEAIGLWLMIKASSQLDNTLLQWLAWVFYLAGSAIGLWGFSRYLTQVLALARRSHEK